MLTTSVFELRLKSCDAAVRDRDLQGFGTKNFNSDGHLITGDSVFPTTAPGGAPKRNRCYQDARYLFISPPCAPLRSRARRASHCSLRYAPAGGWRFLMAWAPAEKFRDS